MELQVAISELFKRLPDLALAGEVVVDETNLTQPITSLPVTW
jgi:cytochrome P450